LLNLIQRLLNIVFPVPKLCLACGHDSDNYDLCPNCRRLVVLKDGFLSCQKCGRYLYSNYVNQNVFCLCRECDVRMPIYSIARSLGPYGGVLKEMIYSFKYQGHRSLADVFGMMLADLFLKEPMLTSIDVLIPVPLSKEKNLSRGYNQSEILAHKMGKLLNLPVNCSLLRTRCTSSQSKLSKKEREKNIMGAFALNGVISNKKVVLVDDILTTGATVCECTVVLLKGGASSVSVLSLASGIQEK
jgi:ComF family protein